MRIFVIFIILALCSFPLQAEQTNDLKLSEIIDILSTVITFLAVIVAIFSKKIEMFFNQAKIRMSIQNKFPDRTKTKHSNNKDVVYFRFNIQNNESNDAENVQVYLTNLYKYKNGKKSELANFLPMRLNWSYSSYNPNEIVLTTRFPYFDCELKSLQITNLPEKANLQRLIKNTNRYCDFFYMELNSNQLVFCTEDRMITNDLNCNIIQETGEYIAEFILACSNMRKTKKYRLSIKYKKPWKNEKDYPKKFSNIIEINNFREIYL